MTSKVDAVMISCGRLTHEETMQVFENLLDEVIDEAALADAIAESAHDVDELIEQLKDKGEQS